MASLRMAKSKQPCREAMAGDNSTLVSPSRSWILGLKLRLVAGTFTYWAISQKDDSPVIVVFLDRVYYIALAGLELTT